jgi:hypothetical protein
MPAGAVHLDEMDLPNDVKRDCRDEIKSKRDRVVDEACSVQEVLVVARLEERVDLVDASDEDNASDRVDGSL